LGFQAFFRRIRRHCEERSDEAIRNGATNWIASSQELLAMTASSAPVTVNNPPTPRGVYQFKTTSRIARIAVTNR
jgi:hypothetical protein